MRVGEKQMVKIGVRIFPCGFGGMQKLTNRGIMFRKELEKKGYEVLQGKGKFNEPKVCPADEGNIINI